MRHIEFCPACGSSPVYTVKKRIDLDKVEGILKEQYLEYNMKLGGESVPNEHFAICGKCAAIYRAMHFTDDEIRTIYTSLYFDFEKKFQDSIIYNDKKLLEECSKRMYSRVRDIEKAYGSPIKDIFDIGGRDGFRLSKLADSGYNCSVYDPIPGKPFTEKICKKNVWSSELKEGENADLITLCNVLEHCMDPRGIVRDCYEHLNEGGFLFIEIPVDFEAFFDWLLFYQLFKQPLAIDVTHHVFFSKRAIRRLLENGKFTVRKINYSKLPVCGVRVMEIVAQKRKGAQAKNVKTNKEDSSSFLFFSVNLVRVFPRVLLNTLDRHCRKFIKMVLR